MKILIPVLMFFLIFNNSANNNYINPDHQDNMNANYINPNQDNDLTIGNDIKKINSDIKTLKKLIYGLYTIIIVIASVISIGIYLFIKKLQEEDCNQEEAKQEIIIEKPKQEKIIEKPKQKINKLNQIVENDDEDEDEKQTIVGLKTKKL